MTSRSLADAGESRCETLLRAMYRGDSHARDELMARLYRRLVCLAKVIQRGFPILDGHPPESILHSSWVRLSRAIEKERPPTVAAFFGLAAHKIRQVLLDLAQQERLRVRVGMAGRGTDSTSLSRAPTSSPEDSTYNPERLALWTELHRKVEELAPEEREVFTLRYYAGLTLAEIAGALEIHPKQASRLWLGAAKTLAKGLPGFHEVL